jgi:xanthine dehydrogenase molybdopterin-binding subunit B
MIVAETRTKALSAARKVVIEYTNTSRPVLNINEVLCTASDRIDDEPLTTEQDDKKELLGK